MDDIVCSVSCLGRAPEYGCAAVRMVLRGECYAGHGESVARWKVRLDYWDDRPEAVDVLLKAKRRVGDR